MTENKTRNRTFSHSLWAVAALGAMISLSSCGGGGSGSSGGGATTLNFEVAPLGQEFLSSAEVNGIVTRAIQASLDRNVASTIAVTDRVGNVLGVYQMNGATALTTITSGKAAADFNQPQNGNSLDGRQVPSTLTAIAKAITGAYLSSTGNAFTTRTASQIVQENFQPGQTNEASGPLFGVQFSQLPCSDLNVWLSQNPTIGPKRSPLGLAADPGGFPIYQNGRVVGGIGVMSGASPTYGFDANIQDVERDLEEEIAWAALTEALQPPEQIRANKITANGQTFQFANALPPTANAASLVGNGTYQVITGYTTTAAAIDGTAYGTAESGYVATTAPAFANLDTFNLVRDAGAVRFPTVASGVSNLSQAEVQGILVEGMTLANRARGQIRIPLGAAAQVTVSVVDLQGNIVGLVRSADAPIFGTDVSVQKARSALLFSSSGFLAEAQAINSAGGQSFANAMNTFFSNKATVLDGTVAFSARAIGNSHRPYFPDGVNSGTAGPLSTPINSWSPFNVGFQLNIVAGEVLTALTGTGRAANDFNPAAANTCADETVASVNANPARYANGIQIFPGGFPIYKGDTLIGAVGISGDGVDQDDMVGYLGVINAAQSVGSNMRPYPSSLTHAGELQNNNNFLKYVQCPQTPFNDSDVQNVCPAVGS